MGGDCVLLAPRWRIVSLLNDFYLGLGLGRLGFRDSLEVLVQRKTHFLSPAVSRTSIHKLQLTPSIYSGKIMRFWQCCAVVTKCLPEENFKNVVI